MTISKAIFDEIDSVVVESNIDVYESLCASYDKAWDILEYCSEDDTDLDMFNIVQEAAIEEDDTDVDAEAKKLGGSIKVVDVVRYERGEGIEKKEDNLADEIAKMIK